MKGILVGGDFTELVMRKHADASLELGELLIAEDADRKTLLQVHDLSYGSQISKQHLELVGGLRMADQDLELFDANLRNYTLARLKALLTLQKSSGRTANAKSLPAFFSEIKALSQEDFEFLQKPDCPLFLGNLRSGSQVLEFPLYIDGKKALSHHVLIAATTGRGKSNLLKCLLWELVQERYAGMLVLDPHDEYYRHSPGLQDHPRRDRVHYYSLDPGAGGTTLRFHLGLLHPEHFNGVANWSQAQREALIAYSRQYGDSWIDAILLEKDLKGQFHDQTLGVLRRRMIRLLDIDCAGDKIMSRGPFVAAGGETTVADICCRLEEGETVIIDTSSLDSRVEILIGSIVASEILRRYKRHKLSGTLEEKPVVSIVLEEAPRVIGKEALERGSNIFGTLAREGRKFKIGLIAVTQLPSLIPREILANMNTKIILGMEMKPERQALIESASQDLSTDDRAIAALDKGEAIVTSTFVPFALPIYTPRFEKIARSAKKRNAFNGVGLE